MPGADGDALETLTELWKSKKNNATPPAFVPQSWDAAALIVLASEAAQSNSGEAIAAKIRDVAGGPGLKLPMYARGSNCSGKAKRSIIKAPVAMSTLMTTVM